MNTSLRTFRGRLAALVALALLPAWILVFTTSLAERQAILQRARQDARTFVQVIATQQAALLETARSDLLAIAHIPQVRSADPSTCAAHLALLKAAFPYYTTLGRADPDGWVRCSAERLEVPIDVSDRDWFREALRRRAFTVGRFVIGRFTRQPTLPLAYPMLDAAGQVQGVLFAGLDLGWLNRLAATLPMPPEATLALLDREGVILAHHPREGGIIGTSFLPAVWQAVRSAPGGDGIAMEGGRRLYAFTPLPQDSGYAVAGISMGAAMDRANQTMARRLALLGALTLLLAAGAWGAGELMLTRPTRRLLGVIRRMQGGDLQARVGWRSRDELGELAQAFDALADQLVVQLVALQRAHAALAVRDRLLTLSLTQTDPDRLYPRLLGELIAYSGAVGGALYRVEDTHLRRVAEHRLGGEAAYPLYALPPWLAGEAHEPPPEIRAHGIRILRRYPLGGAGEAPDRPLIGVLLLGFAAPPDPAGAPPGDLIETLALAVAHAEALREARTRLEQLERLYQIDRTILKHHDLPAIAQLALEGLPAALEVRAADLGLLDERRRRTRTIAIHRAPGVDLDEAVFSLADALLPEWVESPHPIVRADLGAEPWIQPARPRLEAAGVRTYLGIPLTHQGRAIGILHVFSAAPAPLPREAAAFAEILAQQLAIAVENLQAFEEAQERASALEAFVAGAMEAANAAPESAVLVLLETLRRGFRAEAVAFFRPQPEQQALAVGGTLGIAPEALAPLLRASPEEGPGPVKRVALTRASLYIPDTAEEPGGPWAPPARSIYLIPIVFGPTLFGVAALLASRPEAFPASRRALADFFAYLMGAALDLTRHREKLEALNRMLQEALVAREQMIQNVSHELRTPLTILMGYLEMLADQAFGPLTPEQAEVLETMRQRGQQLLRYIELLLTLRKVEREGMTLAPLDLRELVRQAGEAWRVRLAGGPHRIQIELPTEPVWILGDGEALIRMIRELLDNAAKFSPSGGEIRLGLETTETHAVLRMQDHGVGIPLEALSRIFEPFYQVDGSTTRRFGGMGIGLAVVREIVEGHGGTVAIDSEVGKGTLVTVRLPLVRRPGAPPPA